MQSETRQEFGREGVFEKLPTDHGHVEHVKRLRLDCSKETVEEYGMKDRIEDFFGGVSFEDLSGGDGDDARLKG